MVVLGLFMVFLWSCSTFMVILCFLGELFCVSVIILCLIGDFFCLFVFLLHLLVVALCFFVVSFGSLCGRFVPVGGHVGSLWSRLTPEKIHECCVTSNRGSGNPFMASQPLYVRYI